MKKWKKWLEIVCWVIVLLGLFLKMAGLPFGSVLVTMSTGLAALFYLSLSLEPVWNKEIEFVSRVNIIFFRIGVAVASVALLFTAQFWPGSVFFQQCALFLFLANLVLSLSWMLRNASSGVVGTRKILRKTAVQSLSLAIVISFILLMRPSDIKMVLGGWSLPSEIQELMRDCFDEEKNCEEYYKAKSN